MRALSKIQRRERRHVRVRARISGTAERPRLHVRRSLRGMYVQLIDDVSGRTLVSVNSQKDARSDFDAGDRQGKVALAYRLGRALAEKAKAANLRQVIFDRAGFKYHGRVKALAEGARAGGLEF